MKAAGSPPSRSMPAITAVVLAWKDEPWLVECVDSITASEGVDIDVVLVDNGCTSGDVEKIAGNPSVTILKPGRNLGFAGGCNAGVAVARGEFVALVNSDCTVDPRALRRLADVAALPRVGIASASVRLAGDGALINAGENPVHILGLSWAGGYGRRETRSEPVRTASASGACMALSRAHWDQMGGFFDAYFAYLEDAELSLRTWRVGKQVLYVPDAIAVHRYEFARNPMKMFLLERNRLMLVLTMWSRGALMALSPLLAVMELAMLMLSVKQRWSRAKIKSWIWILQNRSVIRGRRGQLQRERAVADREWMAILTSTVDQAVVPMPAGIGAFNAIVRVYWSIVRRAL